MADRSTMGNPLENTADGRGGDLDVRLRVRYGGRMILGPGRADLLQNIESTGSIAAAARLMKMSYRRAWTLMDETNRCFREPLVESVTGGRRGGGARLTEAGRRVLAAYRDMERRSEDLLAEQRAVLQSLLAD